MKRRIAARRAVAQLLGILFVPFAGTAVCQSIAADVSKVISSDHRVALFARAAAKTGLDEVLKGPGPFIAFIPSDQAMINEGSAFLLNHVLLTERNAERLADLVRHHVVRSGNQSTELAGDVELQTLANVPLRVTRVGTGLIVGRYATVTDRIVAANGIVYVVDRLLWPRDLQ